MHHWTRRLFVTAAALLLAGCLWGPGKFGSDLTLRKDGSFTLDYRGEIVLQLPPDFAGAAVPWKDEMAHCVAETRTTPPQPIVMPVPTPPPVVRPAPTPPPVVRTIPTPPPVVRTVPPKERPCSKAEIAEQKAAYEKNQRERAERKRKENEEMAKAFGLPGLDDESNRAFAAKLMKYDGWRSVAYRGNGVFDVDYHLEGRATQDFLFPALPDNDLVIPFVAIRRRADGSVLVTAPALTGGAGPLAARAGKAAAGAARDGPVSRAQGRFTVITDGEILTNNSEDGASPHPIGRQLRWDVGRASTKIPETLIRLR